MPRTETRENDMGRGRVSSYKWFRFYNEVLNDPKAQGLSGDDFKGWVNLLCVASLENNNGTLPGLSDLCFLLRMGQHDVATLLERLQERGMIDRVSGGSSGYTYACHGWSKRQYKSDTSTDRVKRFRNVSRNSDETRKETKKETTVSERLPGRYPSGGVSGCCDATPNACHGLEKKQDKSSTSAQEVKRFRNVTCNSDVTSPDTDTDTDTEKDLLGGKSIDPPTSKTTRFVPPTLAEVAAYCAERKNSVDAQKFVDYYSSTGWMRGKNKIKDWKACVRTWEQNSKQTEQPSKPSPFSSTDPELARRIKETVAARYDFS